MNEHSKQQIVQPSQEVLLVQLQILNERSRWYSGQLWQIPFLYLTIVGAFIGQVLDKPFPFLSLATIAGGLFGFVVAYHMKKLKDGEQRAVRALIEVESCLAIPRKAEHRKEYTDILSRAVVVTGTIMLVLGLTLLALATSLLPV